MGWLIAAVVYVFIGAAFFIAACADAKSKREPSGAEFFWMLLFFVLLWPSFLITGLLR